ncbi:MAG: hypothetical protein ABID38_01150 [Candidatus Diapherotrites archaeon]
MLFPHRKPTPKIVYKSEKQNFNRRAIMLITEQDIINTYSQEEQCSCRKYVEYKELMRENPSFGYKRCAKLLGVSQGRVRWWHTKGAKRAVPLALKAVEKLKNVGIIPFTEEHKHANVILNILGTLFGDGGIDRRLNTAAFISSDKKDVDLWKKDLLEAFPFAKNKMNLVEGGEWGHSYNIRTFDRSIIRFFVALGAPVGDKVAIKYSLPNYIFNVSYEHRIAFLDGMLASEVSVPRFRDDSYQNKRFTDFSLSLSKIDTLQDEHRLFMRSFEDLLNSVEVATTGNLRKDFHLKRKRKDGHLSSPYRIFIRTIFWRVLYFNNLFPLRYCHGKKKRLQKEIEFAVNYKQKSVKRGLEKCL